MKTRKKRAITPKPSRRFAFQAYVEREENRDTIREGAKQREMSVSQFLVFSALKEANGEHTKHTPADGQRQTA